VGPTRDSQTPLKSEEPVNDSGVRTKVTDILMPAIDHSAVKSWVSEIGAEVLGPQAGWVRFVSTIRASTTAVIWWGQLSGLEVLSTRRATPELAYPAEPGVHGLAGHPVPLGHLGPGRSVENLVNRLQPLFHQSQLHQHLRPPSHPWT